eukprot:TRINITY_DN7433_c0_g1_i1.p1 TRINITY_DN7433_c0_g1~~TRINITY_DN7433_c0_g1_i1.p1  ORF type:complete len:528 (+),score=138.71 TRINITY_DN7433_c0_g1_i1:66-1649(+)
MSVDGCKQPKVYPGEPIKLRPRGDPDHWFDAVVVADDGKTLWARYACSRSNNWWSTAVHMTLVLTSVPHDSDCWKKDYKREVTRQQQAREEHQTKMFTGTRYSHMNPGICTTKQSRQRNRSKSMEERRKAAEPPEPKYAKFLNTDADSTTTTAKPSPKWANQPVTRTLPDHSVISAPRRKEKTFTFSEAKRLEKVEEADMKNRDNMYCARTEQRQRRAVERAEAEAEELCKQLEALRQKAIDRLRARMRNAHKQAQAAATSAAVRAASQSHQLPPRSRVSADDCFIAQGDCAVLLDTLSGSLVTVVGPEFVDLTLYHLVEGPRRSTKADTDAATSCVSLAFFDDYDRLMSLDGCDGLLSLSDLPEADLSDLRAEPTLFFTFPEPNHPNPQPDEEQPHGYGCAPPEGAFDFYFAQPQHVEDELDEERAAVSTQEVMSEQAVAVEIQHARDLFENGFINDAELEDRMRALTPAPPEPTVAEPTPVDDVVEPARVQEDYNAQDAEEEEQQRAEEDAFFDGDSVDNLYEDD